MVDNAACSSALVKHLKLKRKPIAVTLLPELPSDIPLLKEGIRFCEMWVKAMEGDVVLATAKEETCGGGAYYLGLTDISREQANGTLLSKIIPLYKTPMAAVRTGLVSPAIAKGTGVAVLIAPLEKASHDVNVCMVVCDPAQTMKLIEAVCYETGGAVEGAGGPATCSIAVAKPYLDGKVTFNVADVGAREYMKLKDDEMIVSIPGDLLSSIVSSLEARNKDA